MSLLNEQADLLLNGALAVTGTAAHIVTGALLTLIILI